MHSGCERGCCITGFTIMWYFIYFTVSILPLMKYNEFSVTTCNVTSVDYPTELPTYNNTNNWKQCRCGKKCKSWTPCINVYATKNDNPQIIYKTKENVNNIRNDCTFYNHKCEDGEDILKVQNALIEAKNTYNRYHDKTITCYQTPFSDIVILNNNFNWNTLIALGVIVGIFTCLCMCSLVHISNTHNRHKNYSTQI